MHSRLEFALGQDVEKKKAEPKLRHISIVTQILTATKDSLFELFPEQSQTTSSCSYEEPSGGFGGG